MWINGLIFLIVVLISFALFKKAAGTMSIEKMNIVSWVFYFHLFIQSFVGIFLVKTFGLSHYLMNRASEKSMTLAFFAVCYVMVVMPISMIFAQKFLLGGRIKEKVTKYYESGIIPVHSQTDGKQIVYWLALTVVTLLATMYTYYVIKEIPLVAFFTSKISSVDFARLRYNAKWGFSGSPYVQHIFSATLAPIVSFVAYGYYRLYRKSNLFRLWFYISVLIAVFAVTYSGEKAPIIEYCITLFFIKGIVDGKLKFQGYFGITLLITIFIVLFYGMFISIGDITYSVTSGPIGRIIMTQIAGLPLHFEVFPKLVPFLRGASFPGWISNTVFSAESIRSARIVKEIFNPGAVSAMTAGVTNTLFIGEAWANFGWFGFVLAPIIVGFVVQFIYNGLISLPKTPLSIAPIGHFMFGLGITGGFVGFVWNATWFIIWLIFMIGIYIFPLSGMRNETRRESLRRKLVEND